MVIFVILMCIVIAFTISIAFILEHKDNTNIYSDEKFTDDVSVIFEESINEE